MDEREPEDSFSDALQPAVSEIWERVLRVLKDMDIGVSQPDETAAFFSRAYALGVGLHHVIETEGYEPPLALVAARNASFALAGTLRRQGGRIEQDLTPEIGQALIYWGVLIGEADIVLALCESGVLSDALAANAKLDDMAARLREQIPAWERDVLPILKKHCAIKTTVSLDELAVLVRRLRATDLTTRIPESDAEIRAGIRRMSMRGDLTILGETASV
jgi:hypothetical protein